MDFHIPSLGELADFLVRFPVLAVLLAGLVFGLAFTQLIKKTYVVYRPLGDPPVSEARYLLTVRWLSALSTYCFTVWLWHGWLEHSGGEEVLCVGTAILSPLIYDAVRALIAWKFPALTANWGRDGTDEPPFSH